MANIGDFEGVVSVVYLKKNRQYSPFTAATTTKYNN